ncbi:transcriptional regulator domain-containing protein [Acidiphilium iwatense]|uniref:DUF6499 domain-containing protein n=1 Tax=Acidiphilium iwatense TaxID=768198 RepID=A0ABS9DX88_9PROT|nr:DUF6499 domain-containing protein [Acidiphilium iwatense]MCF3947361.1 DUF6499 domain-containing protein [Acidiphilium iwatense]
MTPDATRWRSSARYDHVEGLTASDLAWEWLRRNDAYDEDFEALKQAEADPQSLTDKIRQRWGLRFPGGPAPTATHRTDLLAAAGRHERCRPRIRAWRPHSGRRKP